jgi:hypothetical protein
MNWICNQRRLGSISLCALTLLTGLMFTCRPASAQDDDVTFTGTVVSSSRNTLTLQSSEGRYVLFVYAPGVKKPDAIPNGSRARVVASPTEESGVHRATQVAILEQPPSTGQPQQPVVIPPELRGIERDIERTVRRFQVGVRAGVTLDPELIMLGVHAQVGPFFNSNIYFRPNVEFAFGEVTTLFALNPEVIYRLPISARSARWWGYVGIGPGFNFLHQNFEGEEGGNRIDFGDFKSDVGLNILGGIRYRSGMFAELKTTVYSDPSPTLRLIIGYNF